jgi:Transglycosylase-like domain
MRPRTWCPTGVLGEGFIPALTSTIIKRAVGVSAALALRDWVRRRRTCRGSDDDRVGPRRQVRKRWQLEDQHRQWLLRWRAVRCDQAHQATKAEQIAIARRVLAGQGASAWPTCGRRAGLTKSNGKAERNATPATNPESVKNHQGERLEEEDRKEGGSKEVQCKCQ